MQHLLAWLNMERGRRSQLAGKLGITPGALSQWIRVPAEHVLEIESLTGISRHELRPDIFGPAPAEEVG